MTRSALPDGLAAVQVEHVHPGPLQPKTTGSIIAVPGKPGDVLARDAVCQEPRGRRPALCLNRDDLGEAEPVNLPGVAARRGDVRIGWPSPPWSTGRCARLEKIKLGIQGIPADCDRLPGPVVMKGSAEQKLPVAIELAAANSNGSCVGGVGDPENLVAVRRTALDPLTGDCVNGTVTQTHPEMLRIRLPEGGLRAGLSRGEPRQLEWTPCQVAPVSGCGDSSWRRSRHCCLGGLRRRLPAEAVRSGVAAPAHGDDRGKEQDRQHRPSHVDIHTPSTRLRFPFRGWMPGAVQPAVPVARTPGQARCPFVIGGVPE